MRPEDTNHDDQEWIITNDDIGAARQTMKKQFRTDFTGVCIAAWFTLSQHVLADFLNRWANEVIRSDDHNRRGATHSRRHDPTTSIGGALNFGAEATHNFDADATHDQHQRPRYTDSDEETVRPLRAYAVGKLADGPTCKDIRPMFPQSAFLSITDCVIARQLHRKVKDKWHVPRHVHRGNMPYGQLLDSPHGLSLVVERGLDLEGRATIAAAHVSVAKCIGALGIRGTPLARATTRHSCGRESA